MKKHITDVKHTISKRALSKLSKYFIKIFVIRERKEEDECNDERKSDRNKCTHQFQVTKLRAKIIKISINVNTHRHSTCMWGPAHSFSPFRGDPFIKNTFSRDDQRPDLDPVLLGRDQRVSRDGQGSGSRRNVQQDSGFLTKEIYKTKLFSKNLYLSHKNWMTLWVKLTN